MGERRTATGPVRCQLALVPLDQIFSLTPSAVNIFIKPLRGALGKVGDDISYIGALLRRLDPRQNAARTGPGFRGVACGGETTHLVQLPNRATDADIIEFGEHLFGQGFVGTQAEDVFDAVVIAPVHRLLPPVMAVAPDCDDGGWPVQPDAADQPAGMGTNLFSAQRFALTQDRDHAMASLRVVYMDRQKASFVVMGIEQRHLLMPVHRIGGVVDVEYDTLGRMRVALAPEIHHAA